MSGQLSQKISNTLLDEFKDGYHPKISRKWGYVSGMTLMALDRSGQWNGVQRYRDVMKEQMDLFIREDGSIRTYQLEDYNLDQINAGKNLFNLFARTGEVKYEMAINLLATQLKSQPKTNAGGFWHKKIYPFQMWLDGLYMSSPFLAQYGATYGQLEALDEVAHQLLLVEQLTRNKQTGLLVHAYDESKEQRWCHQETGQSRYVWGRAVGWYMMGLVDSIDHFPLDHPKRGLLMGIFERLAHAVISVQDQESGVWYQLLDQNGRAHNYLEASASCMITYALAKGIRLRYLAEIPQAAVDKAYAGIMEQFVTEDEGSIHLHHICEGAGLGGNKKYRDGSYEYYMSEKVSSDVHMGVAPFLLASIEYEKLQETLVEYNG